MSAPLTRAEVQALLAYLDHPWTPSDKFKGAVTEIRTLCAAVQQSWAEHDQLLQKTQGLTRERDHFRDSYARKLDEHSATLTPASELCAERDRLLAENATLAAQVAEMRGAVGLAKSAIWHGHYGGGLTVEYARSAAAEMDAALAIPATHAEQRARAGAEALELLEKIEGWMEVDIIERTDNGWLLSIEPHDGNICAPTLRKLLSAALNEAALRAAKEAADGKA